VYFGDAYAAHSITVLSVRLGCMVLIVLW